MPEPISSHQKRPLHWSPAIDGWLVTGRELARTVMRDAERFTVDDPRFTTGQVLGPSMLSLDGAEHRHHRDPFLPLFRPRVVASELAPLVAAHAIALARAAVANAERQNGRFELRTTFAGPLAVNVISDLLGLGDPAAVLGWYGAIVAAVVDRSDGKPISPEAAEAIDELRKAVSTAAEPGSQLGSLADRSGRQLDDDERFSNAAVVLFGAVETVEGMIANLFWHLATNPEAMAAVRAERPLIDHAVDESLRLEPAASVVDRYATNDVSIAQTPIAKGSLVRISLRSANRDPAHFAEPDRFDLHRANRGDHLAFVQGPHACIGLHLAKEEARAAINSLLDAAPGLAIEPGKGPEGPIFRKPNELWCRVPKSGHAPSPS